MYFLHLNENEICDLKVSNYRCSHVRKIKKNEPGKRLDISIVYLILVIYVTRIFYFKKKNEETGPIRKPYLNFMISIHNFEMY